MLMTTTYMIMEFCTKKINFVTMDQIMYMILMQNVPLCDMIFLSYFRPERIAYAHVIHKKYYSFKFVLQMNINLKLFHVVPLFASDCGLCIYDNFTMPVAHYDHYVWIFKI